MFGEKCIITWAQGESPSGRFNGCPLCQAELLPPRWGYVIDYLMVGLLMAMYEDILQTANFLAANTRVLSISFGLSLGARICDIFPDLPTGSLVELGSAFSLLVFWIYWSLNNVGLRRTLAIITGGTGFLFLWVWLH